MGIESNERIRETARAGYTDIAKGDLPPFFGPVPMRGFHSPVLHRALA